MTWFDQLLSARTVPNEKVAADQALPGRAEPVRVADRNIVTGEPMTPPFPGDLRAVILAGGCFWGIEEIFWKVNGVVSTAVGYAGGYTPNPTYEETCTGRTGHTESTLVMYDPARVSLEHLLRVFWESHDPTQGFRQGSDVGTQYRSAIYTFDENDVDIANRTAEVYGKALAEAGEGPITTEIEQLIRAGDGHFYYAEDYHQQYLAKNPNGYRCHSATGITYPA